MKSISDQAFRDVAEAIAKVRNADYAILAAEKAGEWMDEYEAGLPSLSSQQYEVLNKLLAQ